MRVVAAFTLVHVLAGCTTAFEFVEVPAPAMRTAIDAANAGRKSTVNDATGAAHDVDKDTKVAFGTTEQELESQEQSPLTPPDVASRCSDPSAPGCPYAEARVSWAVGTPRRVVDWGSILGAGVPLVVVGGFVGGNVVCLAADDCAGAVKTAFVVADVALLALAGIGLVVLLATAKNWDHIGD